MGLLWAANGADSLANEWAEVSSYNGGAGNSGCSRDTAGQWDPEVFQQNQVVAPYSPNQRAYYFHVDSLETPVCFSGTRTELGQSLPGRGNENVGSGGFSSSRYFMPGGEYWVSFWLRLGRNWPFDVNWQNVAQFKMLLNTAAANPIMLFQAATNSQGVGPIHLWFNDANTNQFFDLGAVNTETWLQLTVHFLVSSNAATGFVEVLGNYSGKAAATSVKMTKTFLATTSTFTTPSYGLGTGADSPLHARIGIYRNPVVSGTADAWFDGYSVGTSQASAETSAFGGC